MNCMYIQFCVYAWYDDEIWILVLDVCIYRHTMQTHPHLDVLLMLTELNYAVNLAKHHAESGRGSPNTLITLITMITSIIIIIYITILFKDYIDM